MDIFKDKATKDITNTDTQMVQRENALSQRVASDAAEANEEVPGLEEVNDDSDADSISSDNELIDATMMDDGGLHCTNDFEVTYPSQNGSTNNNTPEIISQYDDAPAGSTRSRQEKILAAIDISGSCPTARQSATRAFPMQFLAEFAGAFLDDETGELLEYRHLIKRPLKW